MWRFIYVKGEDIRDKLLAKGFILLNSDKRHHVYVFENDPNIPFTFEHTPDIAFSNMMTF